jgi:large repetitive protein
LATVKALIKLPLSVLLVLCMGSAFAQRGSIIVPASTTIMDPNQDGYVSTTTAGFSNDGYYVDEFEIPMFGIPKLGGDVAGDNVGQPCGITDLIPDSEGYSVYAVRDANNNLIFRFRVGRNNPSVEAWTVLLDADGLFAANDPNATSFNPGFEIDITLIKRNNAGILVYNIDGVENCPQPILNYPLSSNFQIAVADEVSCGDADYFYDFFVPFAEIAAALGIDENTGLRYVAVTNVSATCAMDGKIADISGVDYGDYDDCVPCAFTEIVESQCPTAVVDLCETCEGFNAGLPTRPTIDEPIRAGQIEVCGTSEAGTYIRLSVYSRTGGTDEAPVWSETPREEHVVFVPVSDWCVTLNGPLQAYDRIVARAQLNADGTGCGSASGNEASTSVTVVEPNVAPVAEDQAVEVIEDTPKDIVLVATDADGDPLTYTIVNPPANGVLTGTGANITYTPNQDYFGPDSFTFTASDGVLTSNVATVTITVTPVNDAPVAVDDAFSTNENTPLNATVAGNDNDVDGPSANYSLVTGTTNGNLVLNTDGSFTYTPNTDFNGSDQFVYSLCDGGNPDLCDNATVTITVNPVNSAPVAVDDNFVTDEDTPLNASVAGNDSDADGPGANYALVSGPSNGILTLNPNGTFVYTPNLNYNGSDQFVYSLCDGGTPNLCDNATVSITINPVNDPPIAVDDNFVTDENTPLNEDVSTNDSDVDGPGATYTVVSGPANGVLNLNTNGTFNYTPNAGYFGSDQFVYSLCDGGTPDLCDQATVTITINSSNTAPVAVDDAFVTDEDTPLNASVADNDSDEDGPDAVYSVVNGPANGSLQLNPDGSFLYTPNPDYFGPDQFEYSLCDGGTPNLCDNAIATITVNPVNDPPVITGSLAATLYVTGVGGVVVDNTLQVTDVDDTELVGVVVSISNNFTSGDQLTFVNQNGIAGSYDPGTGVLTLTGNASLADYSTAIASIVFENDGGPSLTRRITFVANDGEDSSQPWHAFIDFEGNTGGPILNENTFETDEDVPLVVCLDVTDPDGDAVFIDSFSNTSGNGEFTLDGGVCFTFTPNPDFNGTETADVTLCDVATPSICNTYSIVITVVPVNDPPVAVDDDISTPEETPVTFNILSNDSDIDSAIDPATIDLNPATPEEDKTIEVPGQGTFTVDNAGNVTFTPAADFTGVVNITYTVKDEEGAVSNAATITVTVTPVNDPPLAVNDQFETNEDTPLNASVATNDTDVDGPSMVYTLITGPSNGNLTLHPDGTLTYTPDLNFNGTDQFEYSLCDGGTPELCATATATIIVHPVNDPPVVQNISVDVDEDTPTQICVTVTDIEGDPSELTNVVVTGNGTAVLDTVGGTFCFIYTPHPDYNGPDEVVVTVCDANDPTVCGSGTVTINVRPINDPPIIVVVGTPVDSLFLTTPEDIPLDFCFDFEDIDGDDTSLNTMVNLLGGGTLDHQAGTQYCFTFTPVSQFNGRSIWDVSICDDGSPSLCGKVIVVIDVLPVDDPPVAVDDVFETDEDVVLNASVATNDINDGPQANYSLLTGTTNGTLVFNGDGSFAYTPSEDYFGADGFTYRLCDGNAPDQCDDATVTITVHPVNDPPVIIPFPELVTIEDSLLQVCVGVTDVDGDIITYEPATNIKGGGTMELDAPPFNFCYTFIPSLNYNGESIWEVSVNDGTVSVKASVKIIVLPVNDPPVASNDYYSVRSGVDTAFNALTNDLPIMAPFKEFYDIYEADSVDNLTMTHILAGPYHGTASFQPGGAIQYKSDFNFTGPDSLRYRVCDYKNLCDTAVVFIEVTPAPFKIWEAFSPNGDGLNEYWRIDGIEAYPNNRVRVFDRYGNMIYEVRGYSNPDGNGNGNMYWNGQSNHGLINGKVPEGTYFYSVELGDGSAVLSGYVVLKLK